MLVIGRVERAILAAIGQEVDRGEITGGVVEEHVFRARVRRVDRTGFRGGVPLVDRGVVLDAGIGRRPGGIADLFPKIAGLEGFHHLAGLTSRQVPVAVVLDGAQEIIGDAHRVVRVLARDGQIGFRIPIGVVDGEFDVGVALPGELDDAEDVVFRDQSLLGGLDLAFERRVLVGIKAIVFVAVAVHSGLHDELEMLGDGLGAGDEGCHLLLFLDLPVDVFLDIGVIDVDDHHLGGSTGGAARLDGARSAVADLEEAHETGRLAAARELFARAAQGREIGAGARAVLEQTCFADPEVHDAVLVDEVVVDRLDEAGVGLGMLVGRFGLDEFVGERVDIEMALAGAVDAIGPVQAGVEPLRGIGGNALGGEHVAQLVIEGAGVVFGREIAALPAPVCPGAGEAIKNLARIHFRAKAVVFGQLGEGLFVGDRTPQPGGDVVFFDLLEDLGDTGLAEIFLRDDVGGDLAPGRGDSDVLELEDHRPVRIADFARGRAEFDAGIGRLPSRSEAPFYLHSSCIPKLGAALLARRPCKRLVVADNVDLIGS